MKIYFIVLLLLVTPIQGFSRSEILDEAILDIDKHVDAASRVKGDWVFSYVEDGSIYVNLYDEGNEIEINIQGDIINHGIVAHNLTKSWVWVISNSTGLKSSVFQLNFGNETSEFIFGKEAKLDIIDIIPLLGDIYIFYNEENHSFIYTKNDSETIEISNTMKAKNILFDGDSFLILLEPNQAYTNIFARYSPSEKIFFTLYESEILVHSFILDELLYTFEEENGTLRVGIYRIKLNSIILLDLVETELGGIVFIRKMYMEENIIQIILERIVIPKEPGIVITHSKVSLMEITIGNNSSNITLTDFYSDVDLIQSEFEDNTILLFFHNSIGEYIETTIGQPIINEGLDVYTTIGIIFVTGTMVYFYYLRKKGRKKNQ